MERLSKALRIMIGGLALAASLGLATGATAQTAPAQAAPVQASPVQVAPSIAGKVEWGIWVDVDGCMHWWADGGTEGYMLDRVNPKTGKPVCLKRNTCLVENTDTLFATDSAKLTADGRRRLEKFFTSAGAFSYAVYGHTDSRASDQYNVKLSQRRAAAVADVGRSVGAVVDRQIGYGESRPVASNATAAGMQKNRRVEVVCYRWGNK